MRIPKKGTRVRAVIDCIYALPAENPRSWSDLRDAYCRAIPGRYLNSTYVGLSMSKFLPTYTTRPARGRYLLKPEVRAELDRANTPVYFVGAGMAKPEVGQNVVMSGSCLSPLNHTASYTIPVREPRMDDLCGTCGEKYGAHYGAAGVADSDCPVKSDLGFFSRAPEDKRTRFWKPARPVVQGSPEIEDMAWKSYGSAGLDAVGELKQTIKDLRGQLKDTISQEMHLDAMMHKDYEINELVDKIADLECVVKNQLSKIIKKDQQLAHIRLILDGRV